MYDLRQEGPNEPPLPSACRGAGHHKVLDLQAQGTQRGDVPAALPMRHNPKPVTDARLRHVYNARVMGKTYRQIAEEHDPKITRAYAALLFFRSLYRLPLNDGEFLVGLGILPDRLVEWAVARRQERVGE